ncbi:hypothetical protein ACWEWX_54265, partial [Streptomyces asiaticus]
GIDPVFGAAYAKSQAGAYGALPTKAVSLPRGRCCYPTQSEVSNRCHLGPASDRKRMLMDAPAGCR